MAIPVCVTPDVLRDGTGLKGIAFHLISGFILSVSGRSELLRSRHKSNTQPTGLPKRRDLAGPAIAQRAAFTYSAGPPRTSRIAWPYLSSLVAPTPLTPDSSASVDGGAAAMSRRVASWKITYGGMPSSLATDVRHARSRSNTGSASGGSSTPGRPGAPPSALAPAPAAGPDRKSVV